MIFSKIEGLEQSMAIELIEKNGTSLDLGTTKSQLFAGISKDLIKDNTIEWDIGAGITSKKNMYLGTHFRIKF